MSLLKHLLFESIYFKNVDEISYFIENNGINLDFKVDYYMASGANGDVFKVKDKDKVIKIEGFNKKLYSVLEDIKEIKSDNIATIHYLKKVNGYMIMVLDYLDEAQDHMHYTSSFFETLLMYIEDALQDEDISYKPSHHKVNVIQTKSFLIKYGFDENKLNEFIDTFKMGGDRFIRALLAIISRRTHQLRDIDKFIDDCIRNKKFLFDIYYGVMDLVDSNIKHGDIHIENILYNTKTKNFQLIDPWVL